MPRVSVVPGDPGYVEDPENWEVFLNGSRVAPGIWIDPVTDTRRHVVTADEGAGKVWFHRVLPPGHRLMDASSEPASRGRRLYPAVALGLVRIRRIVVRDWPAGAPTPAWLRPQMADLHQALLRLIGTPVDVPPCAERTCLGSEAPVAVGLERPAC